MPSKLSLLATFVLLALLGAVPAARAFPGSAPSDVPTVLAPAMAPEEVEEGEAETSDDEEIEVECEADDEECEGESVGSDTEAPPECVLSTAEATVFAFGNRDQVRLQIRYTTTGPTAVTVAYGLHGAKGSLFLGSERKRFGKKGVLRLNESLTEAQMDKVIAAKDFTVRIRALEAPGWCQPYFDRHLDVRRATPAGLTWLQSE